MSNSITVVGTIATRPQEIAPNTQHPFCSFRLANNERRFDREKNEWVDGATNWFTINAFRSLGAHALTSFGVGDRVVVNGRLRVRKWERDGKSGTTVEVDADALGHDLRWGTSKFTKTQTSSPRESTENIESTQLDNGFEHPDSGSNGFADMTTAAVA